MKKILTLMSFSFFLLVGCEDFNSINDNQIADDTIILENKLSKDSKDDYGDYVYNLGDVKNFKVKASKKFKISGKKGGQISLKVSWEHEDQQKIELSAKLKIPKDAYHGDLDFDMIFNLQEYNLELYPSPFTFEKAVKLDLKFKNVDVSLFEDGKSMFNYLGDVSEKIKYKKNKIDIKKRVLEVEGAELYHFSRYGWTRTKK